MTKKKGSKARKRTTCGVESTSEATEAEVKCEERQRRREHKRDQVGRARGEKEIDGS